MPDPKKGKKKVKKGKKKDAESHLDQEQESARALIQLAQGNGAQQPTPYFEKRTSAEEKHPAISSPHQYGPDMTSQDIMTRRSLELSSDSRSKHGKKKRKRHEVSNAIASLQADEPWALNQGGSSTPQSQRLESPSGQLDLPLHHALHPLDDVSTDEEVEMIARGTKEARQDDEACDDNNSSSQKRIKAYVTHKKGGQAELSGDPAFQRARGRDERASDQPLSKNKQRGTVAGALATTDATNPTGSWLDHAVDSAPQTRDDQDQHMVGPLDPSHQDEPSSPNVADGMLGMDMPIDPQLRSMTAPAPTAQMYNAVVTENGLPPVRSPSHEISRKRRRVEEIQIDHGNGDLDEDSVPYYSPYASHQPQFDSQQQASKRTKRQKRAKAGSSKPADGHSQPERNVKQSQIPNDVGPETNNGNTRDHFGPQEISWMERYRDSWVRDHGRSERDFNDIIQANIRGNPSAIQIFNEIQENFPHHRRSYIQRFCRRRFHNYSSRGTWTPVEDEELRQAVAEKGTAWKRVGEMIERFPEDCRDRWRNYLINTEHRNREQWTEAEVVNLASAIMDCIQTLRAEQRRRMEDKHSRNAENLLSDSERERSDMKLINWQAVSDRMGAHGGGRSRLQCSFKWGKLKPEDRRRYLSDARAIQQGTLDLEHLDENHTKESGWRTKSAYKKVSNMLSGDRYDLLQAILNCGAPTEGNIPWKIIGEKWWQDKWTTIERKAAWLMMKRDLPDSEGMDYRDVVYKLLNPLLEQGINERWDPSSYGQTKKPTRKAIRAEKKLQRARKQALAREAQERKETLRRHSKELENGMKSTEYVDDSDNEDGNQRNTSQLEFLDNHNHFDPLLTQTRAQGSLGGQEAPESEGERSVDEKNSLFDESEEDRSEDAVDGKVSQALAQKVLRLKNVR